MNRTWILMRAQMLDFFPINELREPGGKKKNTAVVLGFGIVTLMLFLCVYNILTAKTLAEAGEQALIPAYMVSISSFAILFLTMFRSNGILFGSRDMEMLTTLPVKKSEILGSKFLFMYLLNFLIAVIFMIPGGVIWFGNAEIAVFSFVLYLLSTFFVPLIPMCIASMIGVLIVFFSSHFKNRSIFAVLFSFAALGLFAYLASSGMRGGSQDMSSIGAMLAGQITGLYPLSRLFLQTAGHAAVSGMLLFLVLSFAVIVLFIWVVGAKYGYLNALASETSKYKKRAAPIKKHSPFVTLYTKEMGRFFSSYMAVLNAGLGVVLLCLFSIFLLIMSPQQLGTYAGIEDMNGFLSSYAPFVVVSMLSLSCPAAFSVSLEGKNIWILQSAPVSIKTIPPV